MTKPGPARDLPRCGYSPDLVGIVIRAEPASVMNTEGPSSKLQAPPVFRKNVVRSLAVKISFGSEAPTTQ